MGLEERCEDGDMHVSTASIPIIREHPLDVKDGDSPEDSRIIQIAEDQPANESQLPRTIYAPIGDAEFWMSVHVGLLEYALRTAEQSILDKQLAEARVNLVQNDLYKQFTDKIKLSNQLEAQKELNEQEKMAHQTQTALMLAKQINLVYMMAMTESSHKAEINALEEQQELQLQITMLRASNEVEARENIIKMYEERFGSREELLKLAQAEETCMGKRNCQTRDYNCISKLIKMHEEGKCPKSVGTRMADFVEKLLSPRTYTNIVSALYAAFRGKENHEDSCG
jgi:hypothetical protein